MYVKRIIIANERIVKIMFTSNNINLIIVRFIIIKKLPRGNKNWTKELVLFK